MDNLREKAIRGLECCTADLMKYHQDHFCDMCPYKSTDPRITYCFNKRDLMRDTLSLLKAQESVKPYMDYDGQDVWRCGSCGTTLFHLSHTQADENQQNCVRFCHYCGQVVKWE